MKRRLGKEESTGKGRIEERDKEQMREKRGRTKRMTKGQTNIEHGKQFFLDKYLMRKGLALYICYILPKSDPLGGSNFLGWPSLITRVENFALVKNYVLLENLFTLYFYSVWLVSLALFLYYNIAWKVVNAAVHLVGCLVKN